MSESYSNSLEWLSGDELTEERELLSLLRELLDEDLLNGVSDLSNDGDTEVFRLALGLI